MQKTTPKRSARLPFVRLTQEEKEQFENDYLASSFTSKSAYLRYKLLESEDAGISNKELEEVLLLGSFVDEMKVLSKHFVEFFHFRKEENNGQLSKEETQYFTLILKSIQEMTTQFDKR